MTKARHSIHKRTFAGLFTTMLLLAIATVWAQQTEPQTVIEQFGEAPEVPTGALSAELIEAIDVAFIDSMTDSVWGEDQRDALATVEASNDPRIAWIVSDFMRFISDRNLSSTLAGSASQLLGLDIGRAGHWGLITDQLIAWDIPAPPDYLRVKGAIFTSTLPSWDFIFVEGDVDWRHVSWGGVRIDDRVYDNTNEPCNCIPAADNPAVVSAKDATWPSDDAIVFGVVVNGEARAYPRQIMEVREMVNDTLGGRTVGIPYCTLCGAAQVYFTDQLPEGIERPVLRTSGLLIRSNKVMYDITSGSVIDTFRGTAVTGPLAEKNIRLKQASVITTSWGEWKEAYPETTVLAEELAMGRDFDFRNNRDANGPIFPVGNVDPRLSVHEDIVGAISASGTPVAFVRSTAMIALGKGEKVEAGDVRLELEAGGIKAVDNNGNDLGSHQAFWFAWSQFYPDTTLWSL